MDTSVHAYVVLRHSRGILVFNSGDEDSTRTLYETLAGQGIPSTVAPADPAVASRTGRKRMWVIAGIIIFLVVVAVAVILMMFYVGHVNASMDEDGVTVDAFMVHEDIPYDEITGIELVDDMDYGARVGGYAGADYLSGNFKNDDLGRYTLAVHKSTNLCIVVHRTSDSPVVFNLADNDSTRAFYETLSDAVEANRAVTTSSVTTVLPQAC